MKLKFIEFPLPSKFILPETLEERKKAARRITAAAFRNGALIRAGCSQCQNPKSHAHHEDYAKPNRIVFLCSMHHVDRHHELNWGKCWGNKKSGDVFRVKTRGFTVQLDVTLIKRIKLAAATQRVLMRELIVSALLEKFPKKKGAK